MQGLDKAAFRSKNYKWNKFISFVNGKRSSGHKFSKYDLGRALHALWHGNEHADISAWATREMAQTVFSSSGVFPFNPGKIDRTNLRKTLELPEQVPDQNELLLQGPARVLTEKRVRAMPHDKPDRDITQLRIEADELKERNLKLEEELKLLRGMVRSGPHAGHKEHKATFSKGLCTSDETAEMLEAACSAAEAEAATKAERKRKKEEKRKSELEPGYETKSPSGWSIGQLRAQCALHGISLVDSKGASLTQKPLLAAYLLKFPRPPRKRAHSVMVQLADAPENDGGMPNVPSDGQLLLESE